MGRTLLWLRTQAELVAWQPRNADDQAVKAAIKLIAPADTMVGVSRLRRLVEHASLLVHERIQGSVVECGTWRGGSLALVAWAFRRLADPRPLWAFDSFEGVPAPGCLDPPSAHRGFSPCWCAAKPDDVEAAVRKLGGSADALSIVPGWLDRTLAEAKLRPIALLNVDVDWYDSVSVVLEHLFDQVSPGGIVNFDDYGRWSGCDLAVKDFLRSRSSSLVIHRTGRHGAWLRV